MKTLKWTSDLQKKQYNYQDYAASHYITLKTKILISKII